MAVALTKAQKAKAAAAKAKADKKAAADAAKAAKADSNTTPNRVTIEGEVAPRYTVADYEGRDVEIEELTQVEDDDNEAVINLKGVYARYYSQNPERSDNVVEKRDLLMRLDNIR